MRDEPGFSWISADVLRSLEAEGTDAHRVCSGELGWVERFGSDILISWRATGFLDAARKRLPVWAAENGVGLGRIFARELPRRPEVRTMPVLLDGSPAQPPQALVSERGVRFIVDFSAGYSTGLFLDQRCNRALVRSTKPRRMLNLFAYTCTFSVSAALGGGVTTNVDLSRKSLDRGRENFRQNALDPEGHVFVAGDVARILPRLAREAATFDCIIVDPPTFSRGERGRPFRVVEHFADLALEALALVARGGRVLLSTNSAKMTDKDVRSAARYALEATRRGADLKSEPPPPDIPPEQAAKTLWILLKD